MKAKQYVANLLRSLSNFYKFKILRKHLFAALTESLAAKEIVFRAPPLTEEMVRAINLISPQYVLREDERSRKFWEIEQNACCWGEFEVLSKYLLNRPKPKNCLEIGPGMGRSVVFLTRKLDWGIVQFDLYESSGRRTKYTMNGPRYTDSFCGTIGILKENLKYNNVNNYRIFDAGQLGYKLSNLPGPYDVIYCFYGIGWHWGLEHFIDEILSLMHEKTLAFFLVHDNFEVFEKLKQVNYKIIDYVAAYPANKVNKMLLMSKDKI